MLLGRIGEGQSGCPSPVLAFAIEIKKLYELLKANIDLVCIINQNRLQMMFFARRQNMGIFL